MNPRENLRRALFVIGLTVGVASGGSAYVNYDDHLATHEKVSGMGYNRVLMSPEVVDAVNSSDLWFYGSLAVSIIGFLTAATSLIISEPRTSFTLPKRQDR